MYGRLDRNELRKRIDGNVETMCGEKWHTTIKINRIAPERGPSGHGVCRYDNVLHSVSGSKLMQIMYIYSKHWKTLDKVSSTLLPYTARNSAINATYTSI